MSAFDQLEQGGMMEYIISESMYNVLKRFGCLPVEGEITRCCDCSYARKGAKRGLLCDYFEDANKVPALVTPNGFCAWAVRK